MQNTVGSGKQEVEREKQREGRYKVCAPPPPPASPKIPRKGVMEKLLIAKGQGGFCRKGGDAVGQAIFSIWGVADITTVTFNCILLIVFPFPMNLGVSPCFHCTVLVLVYRVHTFCFHNTVVSSCYRLHTSCLHHASVTSVCACVSDLFLKFAISRELMKECTHTV